MELADGRLQGVVSSGSDIERVYVCVFLAGSHSYSCSTNNNRPCGGGGLCKHLTWLLDEAVEMHGAEKVARHLGVPPDGVSDVRSIARQLNGGSTRFPVAEVFSRFLDYLSHLERPAVDRPLTELVWFPG